jgi:YD repeat-containing protein
LKIGTKAGSYAAKAAIKQLGKEALKEGAAEVLETGAQKLIRTAVATGEKAIDDKAVMALAKQVAKPGMEKEAFAAIKSGLETGLKQEVRHAAERIVKEYALDGASNAIGAFGSGAIQGLGRWDSSKSLDENLAMVFETAGTATAFGLAGGAAFNTTFKVVGLGAKGITKGAGWVYDGVRALRQKADEAAAKPKLDAPPAEKVPDAASAPPGTKAGAVKEEVVSSDEPLAADAEAKKEQLDSGEVPKDKRKTVEAPVPREVWGPGKELPKSSEPLPAPGKKVRPEPAAGEAKPTKGRPRDTVEAKIPREVKKSQEPEAPKSEARKEGAESVDNKTPALGESSLPESRAKDEAFVDDATPRLEEPVKTPSDASEAPPASPSLTKAEQDELVEKMFEFQHAGYEKPDYDRALAKVLGHPLTKPEAVDGLVENLHRLMSEWKGRSLDERERQLQQLMDEFADAQGIPRVKIEVTTDDLGGAAAAYENGIIKVKAAAVHDSSDAAYLIDRLYHEFSHNEQDGLVIRNLADELDDRPQGWTKQDLRDLYKKRTGADLSEEHLDSVLKSRKDVRLTEPQRTRALDLERAQREYPMRQQWFEDLGVANEEYRKLFDAKKPDAVSDLLHRLAGDRDSKLSRQLFGAAGPPPEIEQVLQDIRQNRAFSEEEARTLLKNSIGETVRKGNARFRHEYYRNLLEVEAHMVGRRAAIVADTRAKQSAALPEPPPPRSLKEEMPKTGPVKSSQSEPLPGRDLSAEAKGRPERDAFADEPTLPPDTSAEMESPPSTGDAETKAGRRPPEGTPAPIAGDDRTPAARPGASRRETAAVSGRAEGSAQLDTGKSPAAGAWSEAGDGLFLFRDSRGKPLYVSAAKEPGSTVVVSLNDFSQSFQEVPGGSHYLSPDGKYYAPAGRILPDGTVQLDAPAMTDKGELILVEDRAHGSGTAPSPPPTSASAPARDDATPLGKPIAGPRHDSATPRARPAGERGSAGTVDAVTRSDKPPTTSRLSDKTAGVETDVSKSPDAKRSAPGEPVEVLYDLFKGDNYEFYLASNDRFQSLAGTPAYEYLKYRHGLERVGIGIQTIEEVFPSVVIETSRAEALARTILQPGGVQHVAGSLEEFVPPYLWRDASGQPLRRDDVLALIEAIDRRLKGRKEELDFNHKSAKKLLDRIVPPDRSIGLGDITEESAQFSSLRVRPIDAVLDKGMEFQIDEAHVGLIREIAQRQKDGFIPVGFRTITDDRSGLVRYEVTGWRPATPEERILPLAELTKNLKLVDYGFKDANGLPLLGKMSLGAHDGNDHMRAFRALQDAGLLSKDSKGRGYADLLQQLGDFPGKDMFNRESELIATVAYNWRAFPEMHPSYVPSVKLEQVAEWLSKSAGDMSENQKQALAYVRRLLAEDPSGSSTEAKLLRHIFSAVTTELNEQSRKTGLSFLINPRGVTTEIMTATHPEYVALVIDVTRTLGDPGNSEFLQKLNLRLEEYLRAVAEGAEQGRGKFKLRDVDVESSASTSALVPKEVEDWLARHPGYSTRRAPIRDWELTPADAGTASAPGELAGSELVTSGRVEPQDTSLQDERTGAFSLKELLGKAKEKLGLGESASKPGVVDRSEWRPEDEPNWYPDYGDDVDELAPDAAPEAPAAGISDAPPRAPDRADVSSPVESPPARPARAPGDLSLGSPGAPAAPTRRVINRVGGLELTAGKTVKLGSGADASIQIGSSEVDYYHADVRVDAEGNVFVRDRGSVNGTFVVHADGSKTAVPQNGDVQLRPDDQRILLGDHPVSITSREVSIESPRVSAARVVPPPAPERVFYSQSTAPKTILDEVGGVRLRPGRELTIGRAEGSSIRIPDDHAQVSKRHARVRMDGDGRVYVTDVGSTNGTYIRHADGTTERLTPNIERELTPGDRLLLSDHELSVGRLEPTFAAKIGGRTANFHGGEASIGDGRWGVGPDDAKLILKDDGLYLKVTKDVPIYVNRQRVPAGSEILLRPRDSVAVGEPARVVNEQRQGEWLQLVDTATDAVPRPRDAAEIRGARDQGTEFAQKDEISERLEDGFRSGGRRYAFDTNGDFTRPVNRHAFVVSRKDDAVLREVIDDAKRRFGASDAQGRFRKLDPSDPEYPAQVRRILNDLTPYVHDLFEPPGWSGSGQLDDWDGLFKTHKAGGHVLLGAYIKQGKGVCIQQAVTLKVLCDELGIDATLVRGAGLARQPDTINHAWVEVRLPGEAEPRVYDPRGLVMGKPAGDQASAYHKRGLAIQQEIAARQQEVQAIKQAWRNAKPTADVYIGSAAGGRRIEIADGETVEVGRDVVSGSPEQRGKVSRAHADIVRQDGSLWLRDKSSNGTYVNGVKITAEDGIDGWVSIGPGDRVTLGGPDGPELNLTARADEVTHPMIRVPDAGDRTGILQMPPDSTRPVVKMEHGKVQVPIARSRGQIAYQTRDGLWITIDGRKFPMSEGDGGWWKPVNNDLKSDIGESAIKVHVYVSPGADLNDLARLQEVLIPRLFDDPELTALVQGWKTLNPEIAWRGVDAAGTVRSTGQGAKAFTIYAASPEQALKIQKRVDQILAEHPELKLNKPFAGGNVDVIRGESNRVGIVRDHFKRSPDSTRAELRIQIDDAVFARILNDPEFLPFRADLQYGGIPRLNGAGYRKLEDKLGLVPGTLSLDREGRLTMRVLDYDRTGGYGDIYLPEKGAETHPRGQSYQITQQDGGVKTVVSEGYTNRAAVYKIYENYGADPAEVAAGFVEPSVVRGKNDLVASTVNAKGIRADYQYDSHGQLTEIRFSHGSRYTRVDENTWRISDSRGERELRGRFSVEADGTLVWAPEGGTALALKLNGEKESRVASPEALVSSDNRKPAPSDVKADTEPVSSKDVHDEITPVIHRRAADTAGVPAQVVIRVGDREVALGFGDENAKVIGRSEECDLRIEDRAVSRNHAIIGRDENGFYMLDMGSSNGTWIKRQGRDDFERIESGKPVRLNLPGDEIRLGDPKKPELSLERAAPPADNSKSR